MSHDTPENPSPKTPLLNGLCAQRELLRQLVVQNNTLIAAEYHKVTRVNRGRCPKRRDVRDDIYLLLTRLFDYGEHTVLSNCDAYSYFLEHGGEQYNTNRIMLIRCINIVFPNLVRRKYRGQRCFFNLVKKELK